MNPSTSMGSRRIALLALIVFSACFASPSPDIETMVCQSDRNCPVGYQCIEPNKAGGCRLAGVDALSSSPMRDASNRSDALVSLDSTGAGGSAFVDALDATAASIDTSLDSAWTGDTGGALGVGGATGMDVGAAEGGAVGAGGVVSTGGTIGTGGVVSTGGTVATGGITSTGGTGGSSSLRSDSGIADASSPDLPPPDCAGSSCPTGQLSITPTEQGFNSVEVGQLSSVSTFLVRNIGAGPTGSLSALIAGSSEFTVASNSCPTASLSADGTCSIAVRFAPVSAGNKSASLQVSATPGGTVQATLSGTGVVPTPAALTISPSSYAFPTVTVGGVTGDSIGFSIRNTGGSATTMPLVVSVTGTNVADFVITADLCAGSSLAVGATCAIVVTFKPAALSSGTRTASLNVSGAPGGTVVATLSGTSRECESDSQCTMGYKPRCWNNACVGCISNGVGSNSCDGGVDVAMKLDVAELDSDSVDSH